MAASRLPERPLSFDQRRARDPATPPERLLALAAQSPDDVAANPALPLLAAADPVAHRRLQLALVDAWVSERLRMLWARTSKLKGPSRPYDELLAACSCVERVRPIIEGAYPGEGGFEAALETARRRARGEATRGACQGAERRLLASKAASEPGTSPVGHAISALRALLSPQATGRSEALREAARAVAVAAAAEGGDRDEAYLTERRAQLARLGRYVRREGSDD